MVFPHRHITSYSKLRKHHGLAPPGTSGLGMTSRIPSAPGTASAAPCYGYQATVAFLSIRGLI